jgi:Domain of Unknown Function (DUF1080)
MRRLIPTLLLLAAAGLARAADEPKPNTLTPKEIADGWILLFDGESTFGWRAEGEANVKDGKLIVGGAKKATVTSTTEFGDVELQFQHTWQTVPGASPGDSAGGGRLLGYDVVLPVILDEWVDGYLKADGKAIISKFSRKGGGGSGNGTREGSVRGGIRFDVPRGLQLVLRNVKLRPINTKPLFNGKDLTGWKKYTGDEKRSKTEFGVTKEGYLHLKDGPGDLQSEQQFDDFVLQAECRTNGKNLNSGVFFRCIPGDYQNGYEAQIHNGFADTPKEYVVEEYDPKTHELKDKVKVKSAATDYGTGAIYRRVPARTHAAGDNEWFTMTVVAHGRHIATWVNGVQQVDWADNRPTNANPRNGCRLEKGPVSLQGHDATTDIDFRSIRAVALPKAGGD